VASPPGPNSSERARRGLLARLLGTRGERAAVKALKRRGYRVLGKNLRTPAGELDVLAEERGLLVLVEVKTRTEAEAAGARPSPWDRIGPEGCRRLLGIGRWLTAQKAFQGRGFRADLVAVTFGPKPPLVTIRPDAL
jgi:putative endonuclease